MALETILIENINTFRGSRPAGFDLVEYEKGTGSDLRNWFS